MGRLPLWGLVVAMAIFAFACAGRPALTNGERGDQRLEQTSAEKAATAPDCPVDALRLPPAGIAHATEQALREAPELYSGINLEGMRAMRAARAAWSERSGEIKRRCGGESLRRTVVVDLVFPAMAPSASLSQGTVFVSRFADGYRVWDQAH